MKYLIEIKIDIDNYKLKIINNNELYPKKILRYYSIIYITFIL